MAGARACDRSYPRVLKCLAMFIAKHDPKVVIRVALVMQGAGGSQPFCTNSSTKFGDSKSSRLGPKLRLSPR